jgi:hypothetical protein
LDIAALRDGPTPDQKIDGGDICKKLKGQLAAPERFWPLGYIGAGCSGWTFNAEGFVLCGNRDGAPRMRESATDHDGSFRTRNIQVDILAKPPAAVRGSRNVTAVELLVLPNFRAHS